jgi:hypothetical protein
VKKEKSLLVNCFSKNGSGLDLFFYFLRVRVKRYGFFLKGEEEFIIRGGGEREETRA